MKTILNEYSIVKKCYDAEKPEIESIYRLYKYTQIAKFDGETVLYNMLTGELVILSEIEIDLLKSLPRKYTPEMDELIERKFLVKDSIDDKQLYDQVRTLVNLFGDKNITVYNILTTTGCNARCFYCFEAGAKHIDMKLETAEAVAEYIIKNIKDKSRMIRIHWFGGEPLYNIMPIDVISKKLRDNNILFMTNMTTNGYLFTQKIIQRAKYDWNLKYLQITLDGTENVYNRVKNYIYNKGNPFNKVMDNIALLLTNEINVKIRLNMDSYNKNDLFSLVDMIYEKFGNHKYLTIYAHLLFENCGFNKIIRDENTHKKSIEDFNDLEEYINLKGFSEKIRFPQVFGIGGCMASSDESIMIMPDGNLGKCENYVDKEFVGSIYGSKLDMELVNSWKTYRNCDEKCRDCQYYPQCFITSKCPNIKVRACDEYNISMKRKDLITRMRNEFDIYMINKRS